MYLVEFSLSHGVFTRNFDLQEDASQFIKKLRSRPDYLWAIGVLPNKGGYFK